MDPAGAARLDYFFGRMATAVGSQEHVWGSPVVSKLSLKPSEYWARQCHVGASFMRADEAKLRHEVGVEKIMWGSDYPAQGSELPVLPRGDPARFRRLPAGGGGRDARR